MSEPITLTKAEVEIICDLLEAYGKSSDLRFFKHGSDCKCGVCEAFERVGNSNGPTFDTLCEKLGANQ